MGEDFFCHRHFWKQDHFFCWPYAKQISHRYLIRSKIGFQIKLELMFI